MNNFIFQEAQKLWDSVSLDGEFKNNFLSLEIHEKILKTFHVGSYYYFVFDLNAMEFLFMSKSIRDVLGYNADEIDPGFLLSKIHPEDQLIFLNNENTFSEFLSQLPISKITKYKLSFDYRILNNLNVYVRILQQSVVLQHDDDGRIGKTLLIHTDISHIKSENKSILSFIGLDGEASFYNIEEKKFYLPSKEIFSKREKQVLHYLSLGASSLEIAIELSISRHTVDTHRKNMLAKTGLKNTAELINKVIKEGLI